MDLIPDDCPQNSNNNDDRIRFLRLLHIFLSAPAENGGRNVFLHFLIVSPWWSPFSSRPILFILHWTYSFGAMRSRMEKSIAGKRKNTFNARIIKAKRHRTGKCKRPTQQELIYLKKWCLNLQLQWFRLQPLYLFITMGHCSTSRD